MPSETLEVYLSCSRHDQSLATRIVSKLNSHEIKSWYALRGNLLQMNVLDAIGKAIESCQVVVVLLTSHYAADPYLHSDMFRAAKQGKPFVIFATEDVSWPDAIHYIRQHAHKYHSSASIVPLHAWGDSLEPHLDTLIHVLKIWLGKTDEQVKRSASLELDFFYNPSSEDTETISVLFLSADPTDASRLRLGEEFREIQEQLKLAKLRERFRLELPQLSVRPADISRALLDSEPSIIHFSGHGTSSGALCFEDRTGQVQLVHPHALAALLEQFADQVHCVLLNACFSESQAAAIAQHVEYVIGMNQAITDGAAIAFVIGFYQALGAGRSIEDAYKFGCIQIQLQGIPEHLTPTLVTKQQSQQTSQPPVLKLQENGQELPCDMTLDLEFDVHGLVVKDEQEFHASLVEALFAAENETQASYLTL